MPNPQVNIRPGETTKQQVARLKELYGTKTTVYTVAIDRFYSDMFRDGKPEKTVPYLLQWLENLRKWVGEEIVSDCEPGKTILGGKGEAS